MIVWSAVVTPDLFQGLSVAWRREKVDEERGGGGEKREERREKREERREKREERREKREERREKRERINILCHIHNRFQDDNNNHNASFLLI
jgi:hypothetical protein